MAFSKETIESELEHTAKLDKKNLGELAELAFMRRAASLGFAVAKPWGDSDRYDVIVRFDKMCWRVQVKSVITSQPSRHSYRLKTTQILRSVGLMKPASVAIATNVLAIPEFAAKSASDT